LIPAIGGVGEMRKSWRDRAIITSSRLFQDAFKTSQGENGRSARINFHYDGFLWTAAATVAAITVLPPTTTTTTIGEVLGVHD